MKALTLEEIPLVQVRLFPSDIKSRYLTKCLRPEKDVIVSSYEEEVENVSNPPNNALVIIES